MGVVCSATAMTMRVHYQSSHLSTCPDLPLHPSQPTELNETLWKDEGCISERVVQAWDILIIMFGGCGCSGRGLFGCTGSKLLLTALSMA